MKLTTTKKVPWKHLQIVIQQNHTIQGHLFRTPSVQRRYFYNRQKMQRFYGSFEDFIKISLLRFGSYMDTNNKLCAYATHTSKQWVWCENTYPYSLRKGIHHYNIWSVEPLQPHTVNDIIHTVLPDTSKFLWFINNTEHMSVPGVWHCHVFWK